jgi:hypothetical protein
MSDEGAKGPIAADLVIETLALSEAEQRERIVELLADVRSYFDLAHEAIHTVATVTTQRDRGTKTIIRLMTALREERAHNADLRQQLADLRREAAE